ncbi:hypothetical protein CEXT_739321 [Caerostris extrusa]|uniref:Uncharacterized protein n=1 Tax=Caerostris extrusa TaxID=172846 RepID=A0AAV4R1S8_CAEEX|nr:hypothetical protein CEXT_739321 [Caerostris extrusa]
MKHLSLSPPIRKDNPQLGLLHSAVKRLPILPSLIHAPGFKRKGRDKDLLQWLVRGQSMGQHDKPIRCGTDVLRVQCPMRAITLFQWRPLPPLSAKRLFIAFRGMSIRRRRGGEGG